MARTARSGRVLGAGVVGSQVVRLLGEQADELAARVGRAAASWSAWRCAGPHRHPEIPADLLTTDAAGAGRPGRRRHRGRGDRRHRTHQGPAADRAARAAPAVVTANKALLAEDGPALYEAADAAGADLYFEAAVAGAIPLIRPIRESLAGDRISPDHGDRQRHDQLHPVADGRHRWRATSSR